MENPGSVFQNIYLSNNNVVSFSKQMCFKLFSNVIEICNFQVNWKTFPE